MKILGHRGSAGRPDRPENTLGAVRAGLDQGAAGVEVDVRLTADGVLVCSHDADLGRVSGAGAGCGPAVAGTTFAELRSVPLPGGARIARFEEVLDLAASRGALVVAEVKPVPGPRRLDAARALADVLSARRRLQGRVDRVTTSSFDPLAAAALVGAAGAAAMLLEPWDDADRAAVQARTAGIAELHLPVETLRRDPGTVRRAHGLGLRVVVWTANEAEDLHRAAALGVSGAISDHPWLALAVGHPAGAGVAVGNGVPADDVLESVPSVRPRRGALAART